MEWSTLCSAAADVVVDSRFDVTDSQKSQKKTSIQILNRTASAALAPPLIHEDRKPHEARRGEPADLVIWVEILTQLRLNVLRKTAPLTDNSLSASPEPSGNGLSKDKLKTTEG